MKTINGAPQFETADDVMCIETMSDQNALNAKLKEWAAARACVKCTHLINEYEDKPSHRDLGCYNCKVINKAMFAGSKEILDPETFSCAAFEEKK